LGVPDAFAPTGTAQFLLDYFGLNAAGMERAALDLLSKEA
jgi:transketolase C-terminal domain/subunit